MTLFAPARSLLDDLEARQEEVLRQLDELNERLEAMLRQHSSQRTATLAPAVSGANNSAATTSGVPAAPSW